MSETVTPLLLAPSDLKPAVSRALFKLIKSSGQLVKMHFETCCMNNALLPCSELICVGALAGGHLCMDDISDVQILSDFASFGIVSYFNVERCISRHALYLSSRAVSRHDTSSRLMGCTREMRA